MSRVWLVPGGVLLALAIFGAPTLNPDAMEMVDVGRCLWGLSGVDVDCAALDSLAYPPLYPLIAGLLSAVFGPWSAAVLVGALGAALLAVPLGLLAQRLAPRGFLVAVTLVVLHPVLRFYSTTSDPRLGALALVLAAWVLVLDEERSSRSLWLAGVLAGLAVLVRPEGILHAAFLGLGALIFCGRRGWRSLVGLGAVVLPYLALLSWRLGGWVISPRAWELKGAPLLDLLPVRWLIQLWGVGATNPPFRSWLQQAEAGVSQMGDPVASLAAVGGILLDEAPWELHALALLGLGVALAQGRCRRTLLALGLVGLPAVIVGLSPMGVDFGMPLKNLLPILVVEAILAVVSVCWTASLLPRRHQALGTWGIVVLMAAVWLPKSHLENQFWPAMSEESEQAAAWLAEHTAADAVVGASFGSGPVVRRAGRRHAVIPSPWETRTWESNPPDFLVVTGIDGIWPFRSQDLARVGPSSPVAFFSTAQGWAMVLEH